MRIPAVVYDRYNEAMALFLSSDNFGVNCQLVFRRTATVSPAPTEPVRQRLTLNGPHSGQAGMIRGNEATKVVETTTSITLRVYHDKKSFDKIGMFTFVAGSCMTIAPLSSIDEITKAHSIIIGGSRYERSDEVKTWGLNGEYCVAYWGKI